MIEEDELAAITAALAVLRAQSEPDVATEGSSSRWKLAARNPELEIEELRVL